MDSSCPSLILRQIDKAEIVAVLASNIFTVLQRKVAIAGFPSVRLQPALETRKSVPRAGWGHSDGNPATATLICKTVKILLAKTATTSALSTETPNDAASLSHVEASDDEMEVAAGGPNPLARHEASRSHTSTALMRCSSPQAFATLLFLARASLQAPATRRYQSPG